MKGIWDLRVDSYDARMCLFLYKGTPSYPTYFIYKLLFSHDVISSLCFTQESRLKACWPHSGQMRLYLLYNLLPHLSAAICQEGMPPRKIGAYFSGIAAPMLEPCCQAYHTRQGPPSALQP